MVGTYCEPDPESSEMSTDSDSSEDDSGSSQDPKRDQDEENATANRLGGIHLSEGSGVEEEG